MTHFVTVHFENPAWIKIQTDFIRKFGGPNICIHAILTDIPQEYAQYFDKVYESPYRDHSLNLNFLSNKVAENADSDDLIVFLDGDAFPIAPIKKYEKLLEEGTKLIAIQRLENNGDIQPHPCFTITSVRFWAELPGDWSAGFKWKDAQGDRVTDVGGNLLSLLIENDIDWMPLLRSNKSELHPLLFGIYDDTIYHHGAGFRRVFGGRISAVNAGIKKARAQKLSRFFQKYVPTSFEWWLFKYDLHPLSRIYAPLEKKLKPLSIDIYQRIKENPQFIYNFNKEGSFKS